MRDYWSRTVPIIVAAQPREHQSFALACAPPAQLATQRRAPAALE